MEISGDGQHLNPQPLPPPVKSKGLSEKDELAINKSKLAEMKQQMKFMKGKIQKLKEIIQKEVGDEIDMKELFRQGISGWQGRAQTVMNLRLKLTAMRSKFLDPPHKMYYRGPFDPNKEIDLKCLPQKQENLYKRMLNDKKEKVLQQDKPIAVMKKELDDLCLMYRAARSRTKNLISKVNDASKKLYVAKEKSEYDLRVIEAMMAHQSLFKMMVESEGFQLDPILKRHVRINPLEPQPVSEWTQYKMSFEETEKKKQLFRNVTLSLVEKLDKISQDLIETEKLNIENRITLATQNATETPVAGKDKKQKAKDESENIENELRILTLENQRLREILLHSALLASEDFKMFLKGVDVLRNSFLTILMKIKDDMYERSPTKND